MFLFRILFGIYALLVFLCTLVVLVPAYILVFNLLSKNKAPHVAHGISRGWARFLLVMYCIRLKTQGKENLNPKQTYVFVSNHQSQLDIPCFAVACKNTFRFLSKAELTKIPLLGYVIKNLYITVKRGDKSDRVKSIEAMQQSLADGISIIIFPEGTRNRTEAPLLDFRDGAFRLAIQTQKPLAVLTILNSKKLNSPKKLLQLSPGIVHAVWSEPIETQGMTNDDVDALKERAKQIMLKHLSA